MTYLHGRSLLITGATGSFGKAFIRHALDHLEPARIVLFSRDELKQYEIRNLFEEDSRLRFFIGDVRDESRLRRAMHGVDTVIHAAAMKQVDTAEYNPFEAIQTNIMGAENVINASIDTGVEKVVALSTDKASSPINLYGATKLCSDKLFVAGNHYAAHGRTCFAVVRYGNVLGSRGSVVPFFQRLAPTGRLPITDRRMTRFWITLPQAVEFVVDAFNRMRGGELFVPKLPSMRITDLARAIAPDAELAEVGMRPGEKLHEEMISEADSVRTLEFGDHFVIQPVLAIWGQEPPADGTPMAPNTAYRSDTNEKQLSVEQLRAWVAELPTDRRIGIPG